MQLCERCDNRYDSWRVNRYELRIGEIHRLPILCEDCAVHVMSAVMIALRKPAREKGVSDV